MLRAWRVDRAEQHKSRRRVEGTKATRRMQEARQVQQCGKACVGGNANSSRLLEQRVLALDLVEASLHDLGAHGLGLGLKVLAGHLDLLLGGGDTGWVACQGHVRTA